MTRVLPSLKSFAVPISALMVWEYDYPGPGYGMTVRMYTFRNETCEFFLLDRQEVICFTQKKGDRFPLFLCSKSALCIRRSTGAMQTLGPKL